MKEDKECQPMRLESSLQCPAFQIMANFVPVW